MAARELPISNGDIRDLTSELPTPFYLYDEAGIRSTAQDLNQTFDWVAPRGGVGYVNHFAVKATPNPHILAVLENEGMGADASSGPEIAIAKAVGLDNPYIMFTSNNTPPEEYLEAYRAGAIINLDDINQIPVLMQALGGNLPETISFRYNPGSKKSAGVNSIIGNPEDAKFGIPDQQLEDACRMAKKLGVQRFGIHTMVASNELDPMQHVATAEILFAKVAELSSKLKIKFEFANLGGGLGIPYRPKQKPLDRSILRAGVSAAYQKHIVGNRLQPLRVVTENGRYVTGPHGYLVTTARSIKETFHRYVGLDASMADLMRPGMYDAYHEIVVLGKSGRKKVLQRVVGSLCENNDHFTGSETKERLLPKIKEGDTVVICDAGAHGHAMGFNYNGKLRPSEYLLNADGSVKKIREAETRANLFATIVGYPELHTEQ